MLGVFWMLVILLSCMASQAQQSTNETQLKIYVLTAKCHQPVFVPCPKASDDDVMFELFKDQDMVCQVGIKSHTTCNETQLDVQPRTNKFNQVDGFNLNATPTANKTIYRCEGRVMHPPPIKNVESLQRIMILKNEDHCSCNKSNKTAKEENKRSPWIWITVVSLLSTYSVVVTIVALVIWFKLKEADYQNDYINTKPKAPRNRGKKRGLQTPIPRYI